VRDAFVPIAGVADSSCREVAIVRRAPHHGNVEGVLRNSSSRSSITCLERSLRSASMPRSSSTCLFNTNTVSSTAIDGGPYRVVRHPGYVGSILVWGGSRLAVNWLVAAATVFVLVLVYAYRISAEERMLVNDFGDTYRAYKTRTWRLLPFVW
jgi:Phospholipid methyltransferase